VKLIATRARLIGHRQAIGASQPPDETTDRALSALEAHHLWVTARRWKRRGDERELVLVDRDPRPDLGRER
jgi:hypothetical protein